MTDSDPLPEWIQDAVNAGTILDNLRATLSQYSISTTAADVLLYQLIGSGEQGKLHVGYCPDDRTRTTELLHTLSETQSGTTYTNAAGALSYTGLFGSANGSEGYTPGVLLDEQTTNVYIENSHELIDKATGALTQFISTQSYTVTLLDVRETIGNESSVTLVAPARRGIRVNEDRETFLSETFGVTHQLLSKLDILVHDTDVPMKESATRLSPSEFKTFLKTVRDISPQFSEQTHSLITEIAQEMSQQTGVLPEKLSNTLHKLSTSSARLALEHDVRPEDVSTAASLLRQTLQTRTALPEDSEPIPVQPEQSVPSTVENEGEDPTVSLEENQRIDPETGEIQTITEEEDNDITIADEHGSSPVDETPTETGGKLLSFRTGADEADETDDDKTPSESTDEIIEAGVMGSEIVSTNAPEEQDDSVKTNKPDTTESDIITAAGYGQSDIRDSTSSTANTSASDDASTTKAPVKREEDTHTIVEYTTTPQEGVSSTVVREMADLVERLGREHDDCKVPSKEVFERAEDEEGIDNETAAEALSKLENSGEVLYYKRTGHFHYP